MIFRSELIGIFKVFNFGGNPKLNLGETISKFKFISK